MNFILIALVYISYFEGKFSPHHYQLLICIYIYFDVPELFWSPYVGPVVIIKKKNGTRRFCIDYINFKYAITRIDMAVDSLHEAKYFTTLDLAVDYFQVPLDEESKPKTAFRTTNGLC